jgi:PEP-CTERM motif
MSLQDAATLLGVDHFNWLQTIDHIPLSWDLQAYNNPVITQDAAGAYSVGGQSLFDVRLDTAISAVPEPSTLAMSSILLGMFGVAWSFKRRKRTAAV